MIGVNSQRGSDAHLAMPCAAETKPSKPTCHSAILPGEAPYLDLFDTCFVTGCLGAKQSYVDAYVTSAPRSEPDDRAPITYPMRAPFPSGTVTYDPNPLIRWHTDATEGTNANNVLSMTLDLRLPNLSESGLVHVSLQLFDDQPNLGKIVAGDVTLAELAEDSFVWRQ